ncbi:hypothetical protein ACH5RR_012465 [Cinchona calisaya]|uniref:Uncharacterized protein n=1 Tax=Cinchona calisaya TaxID=153742 RepID=A0ABD3A9C1_9GENT
MPVTNQDARPLGVSKEKNAEENQVPGQYRETPLELSAQEKVQISKNPKDEIGLTTSDGANLENKDQVGQELTSSKNDETTSDQLGNRLKD